MTEKEIFLASGFVLIMVLAYLFCLAASFRLRWIHYLPLAAATFACQLSLEKYLGPNLLDTKSILLLGLFVLGAAGLAWRRFPDDLRTGDVPADGGVPAGSGLEPMNREWFSQSLAAPHARKLWFAVAFLPLPPLFLFGQILAAAWFGTNLNLAVALAVPGLVFLPVLAWLFHTFRCPDCGLHLLRDWSTGKSSGPLATLFSLRQCPRCGYRRPPDPDPLKEEDAVKLESAPGPKDLTIAFTAGTEGTLWRQKARRRFDTSYWFRMGPAGMILLIPFSMFSYFWWIGRDSLSFGLLFLLLLELILPPSTRKEYTATYSLRSEGVYFGDRLEKLARYWSPRTKAIAFEDGLVVVDGKSLLLALPPQILDDNLRAALRRFFADRGIAVEGGDTP